MSSKTRVIIALVIVISIFIISLAIALVYKFKGESEIEDSNESSIVSSIIISSSNISTNLDSFDSQTNNESNSYYENSNILTGNDSQSTVSNYITYSSSNIESSKHIPEYTRPNIDTTMSDIDYAGMDNLTSLQNTQVTRIKLSQLLADATLGKVVDYAEILKTSTSEKVLIDVHFKNGEVVNYTILFDTLKTNNFTRCVTTSTYDFIMNGGNLE